MQLQLLVLVFVYDPNLRCFLGMNDSYKQFLRSMMQKEKQQHRLS